MTTNSNFILKEILEEKDWNVSITGGVEYFSQTFFYGEWQKSLGRHVKRFVIFNEGLPVCFFQIIFYPLFFGKKYAYTPYGPVVKKWTLELLLFLKKELNAIAQKEKAVFVRVELFAEFSKSIERHFFKKAPTYSILGSVFQPRYEWMISLKGTPEEILANMHQKTRYSIRLAEKKGVEVEIVEKDLKKYLPDFIALMKETSKRNNFDIHKDSYFEKLFDLGESRGQCFLSVARFEGKIRAIDFIFISRDIANYLFGASSNEDRNSQAPYLAHWQAILKAKEKELKYYNLGGVEDPERKIYKTWGSLSAFKYKWGGELERHPRFYDLVVNKFWYYLYIFRKYIKFRKHIKS